MRQASPGAVRWGAEADRRVKPAGPLRPGSRGKPPECMARRAVAWSPGAGSGMVRREPAVAWCAGPGAKGRAAGAALSPGAVSGPAGVLCRAAGLKVSGRAAGTEFSEEKHA